MGSIADELATVPFLRRVPANELRTYAPLWEPLSLDAGEVLWDAGHRAEGVAILLFGELSAELDGVVVGRVGPGELLGEVSAFFPDAGRSATLRAKTAAQAVLLPRAGLHTLRWQRSAIYDALLEQSLLTLVRRVAAANARITVTSAGGVAAPARVEPSALVRLWKALRPGGPSKPCPPLEPLLRALPGLANADGETLAALGQAFVATPVEEGEVVFLEGEPGAEAWIVADGQVDVLRNVRGDRAEHLASLGPGAFFGLNTLIERGPRTASCVAAKPGWLYRIDADGYAAIRGPNRLAWRECLLGVLATQIRNANGLLQKASGGPKTTPRPKAAPVGDAAFQELLRASGWLEGVPDTLDAMEVVLTEDARRNPKNRRLS